MSTAGHTAVIALLTLAPLCAQRQKLPPVPVPTENPLTAAKAVLGKSLFWDEQLSSDGSMACGTCHRPAAGGSDPRTTRGPGPDGKLLTRDDGFGSPGIALPKNRGADASDSFLDELLDRRHQVTARIAPSNLTAQYAPELFWDGRAKGEFRDPMTDRVLIPRGGALESQSLVPILSTVEMSAAKRSWQDVVDKLAAARPLALATDLPPDVKSAIETHRTYPKLFEAAFGDPAITPARIAFALASYQRTLVPDHTPYDRFVAGDDDALNDNQKRGLRYFRQFRCADCHTPPLFTDHSFRNVGVHDRAKDVGRQGVTGKSADRARFKVPSLRNVALRPRFMHNGKFGAVNDSMRIYRWPSRDPDIDPLLRRGRNINHRANDDTPLMDFLKRSLTDPRVAKEEYPFDRPRLRSERTQADDR